MGLLYQKRRLKANKIRRKIASTRAQLQRIRVLLALLMTVAIGAFYYFVLKMPQWYIDTEKLMKADSSVLKIQGNVITPEYKIIDMIRQAKLPRTQIFRLDTKELEKNISRLQPIKKVYIRRYWFPARMTIAVDERTPAFLLAPNTESEPNSALTIDGVLIDRDYLPLNPSIKAKKLLTYGVRDGRDEVWDKKSVEGIARLVKAIETYSNQEVKYIDLRAEKDVYIMLEEHLIRFGEIDDTALKRAKNVAAALKEVKKMNEKIIYIDLRWEKDLVYVKTGTKNKEENKVIEKIPEDKKDKKIDKKKEKELEKELEKEQEKELEKEIKEQKNKEVEKQPEEEILE